MAATTNDMTLPERIEALEVQILALRTELARTRLEQWTGRLEHLEVQYRLGRMETDERIGSLLTDLRHRIAKARARAESRGEAAGEAVDTLATGVEVVFADLREAMAQARGVVTR
ncbi:hypothetical protein [Phycicoccus sp. Soil748]|uniref:hypothetical protein n=1 Tax=Phycicoccus sp. Soil748 TaxID=1736397 RepID=UPI000703509A|nr:hypothetical protein [Phycicoccus sp. Soil748]KRE53895.1 hypothetical protein ASG70_12535 [Phycicoccus sp. Soil748]